MKKLDTTLRKSLLATGAEFLKALSDVDEVEAAAGDAKRLLEETQSELAATQAQLENSKAELVRANEEYARWSKTTEKQHAAGSARIDLLTQKLESLEEQVAAKSAELNSTLAGMAALSKRLATQAAG